ncbi:hypothetical protein GPECTOR_42g816 [Gonium pectorale]|uniref:Uncharacterized protein n=1 Tax=Gonium pectorale TaxID=33097 RepID=A0A150GAK9_GONPE|nr:hypothetical protein GPECTOR_42g816 [Gonium pectorale]|eukprot:KXZ46605.1 hypothetical protein GPECTOR_42g816 [Gonium pectorale]
MLNPSALNPAPCACSFVRIQSTACEQQNLEALMCELDAHLLVSLALGHCCLVYDLGSRGRDGTPRALWYGLEFVRYTLTKLWLRKPCPAVLRGKNVARTFEAHIRGFKQSTTRRLQYYAKYIPPGLERLRLHGVFRPTLHDYDTAFYVALLHQRQLEGSRSNAPVAELGGTGILPPAVPPGAPTRQVAARSEATPVQAETLPAAERPAPALASSAAGIRKADLGPETARVRKGEEGREVGASLTQLASAAPAGRDGEAWTGRLLAEPTSDPQARLAYGEDGEAALARHGFRVFWRGLTPQEWTALAQQQDPQEHRPAVGTGAPRGDGAE